MYSQERIRLMTQAALYETKEARRDLYINGFTRSDYLSFYMFKTVICVTAAYLCLGVMLGVYWIEEGLAFLQNVSIPLLLISALLIYVIVLFVFIIIALIVYSYRYERAQKSVKRHLQVLKALERLYREEAMRTNASLRLSETQSFDSSELEDMVFASYGSEEKGEQL